LVLVLALLQVLALVLPLPQARGPASTTKRADRLHLQRWRRCFQRLLAE
jgi:hypothetical protein